MLIHWILTSTLQTGVIAAVMLAIRAATGGRFAPRWQAFLWLAVLLPLATTWVPPIPAGLHPVTAVPMHWDIFAGNRTPAYTPSVPMPPVRPTPLLPAGAGGLLMKAVWGLGTVWLGVRLFVREGQFRRAIRETARPVVDDHVTSAAGQRVPIWETSAVSAPAAYGLWRPKILVPPRLVQTLNPEQWRLVSAHEYSHVRFGDIWVRWIFETAVILFWFNPFIWMARHAIRAAQEMAADDAALQGGLEDGRAYGTTLLTVAAFFGRAVTVPSAAGMELSRGTLAQRLRRLADMPRPAAVRWATAAGAVIMVLGVLSASVGAAAVSAPQALVDDWPVTINRAGGVTVSYEGWGASNAVIRVYRQWPDGHWRLQSGLNAGGPFIRRGRQLFNATELGPPSGIKVVVHWEQGDSAERLKEVFRLRPHSPYWLSLVSSRLESNAPMAHSHAARVVR